MSIKNRETNEEETDWLPPTPGFDFNHLNH